MLAFLGDNMSRSQKNWCVSRHCWLNVSRPWVNYVTSMNISYYLLKMRRMFAFAYLLDATSMKDLYIPSNTSYITLQMGYIQELVSPRKYFCLCNIFQPQGKKNILNEIMYLLVTHRVICNYHLPCGLAVDVLRLLAFLN